MLLDISSIIYVDGGRIPFNGEFDFSDFDFNGERSASEPILASGQVVNRAGALVVQGSVDTTMHPRCDRCAQPFAKRVSIPIDALVAVDLPDDDCDSLFPIVDGKIDLEEIVTTTFVLNLDSKNLCSEDCLGLCPGCGADLNHEPCRCKKEIDPRLAALSQLLKDRSDNQDN